MEKVLQFEINEFRFYFQTHGFLEKLSWAYVHEKYYATGATKKLKKKSGCSDSSEVGDLNIGCDFQNLEPYQFESEKQNQANSF